MTKWTEEQLEAIEKEGTNIIVSAGAGSGKTAVLTERVIHKLKKGIKINELLILTFTNAAAGEMKERIRQKIYQHDDLKDNLDYLESAYITTFDSYTLSLVKKYHYLLNVSSDLNIIDTGVISILKEEILDKIFDDYYSSNNFLFNKLINDFCIKNDKELKKSLLKIINAMELISDKEKYLNEYLKKYFDKDYLNKIVQDYLNLIYDEVKNIEINLYFLENSDFNDYYEDISNALEPLLKAKGYEELKHSADINMPRRPKDSDEIKEYKDNIDLSLKTIKDYLRFESSEEIYESLAITKDYIEIIIQIIQKFNQNIANYKNENDLYEFTDIELMAINLLKQNSMIRDEIKNFYQEIMVDEYQDTNDLQEEFISLIAHDNVYMVGDVKQSIYGFRNANPTIFKNKYDTYTDLGNGYKIDLLKNFRSRGEVLAGINEIFNLIMDDFLGGANYQKAHQMLFGNLIYEENKAVDQNYNLQILDYKADKDKFSKEEIEAFIIGNDIKEKIKNNFKVINKKTNKLTSANYNDFCIIMDRGSAFTTYKKIFEFLQIPLNIYEDKKLTDEVDTLLINNILGLILKINEKEYDVEFKYFFMSIARSYLFEYSDNKILDIINNKSYFETEIYQICSNIQEKIDSVSSFEIIKQIIEKFHFYEKIIKVGNVTDHILQLQNLLNTAYTSSFSPEEFKKYLTQMIDKGIEITYKDNNSSNGVKIMNIHKSKGLEFPICYFSGFHKAFNTSDIKERFVYDQKYGIITPFFKEGIGTTILKDLLKNKYNEENISERIRLLYVALTRAKEQMIIVASLNEDQKFVSKVVDPIIRKKYSSFLSIINSISGNLSKYIKNISLNNLNLSKDYLHFQNKNISLNKASEDLIHFEMVNIQNEIEEEKHASKTISKIITSEEANVLRYGTHLHEIFEHTDFLNIDDAAPYQKILKNFVNQLNITKKTKIYKEQEFIYEKDNVTYHGIIDLVLVEHDKVKIVDYKLKNIDDENYVKQLNIYKDYISSLFDLPIETYLYSIINEELRLIY